MNFKHHALVFLVAAAFIFSCGFLAGVGIAVCLQRAFIFGIIITTLEGLVQYLFVRFERQNSKVLGGRVDLTVDDGAAGGAGPGKGASPGQAGSESPDPAARDMVMNGDDEIKLDSQKVKLDKLVNILRKKIDE